MGLLSTNDVDYIRSCLAEIAGDVEEAITYKRYTGTTAGDQVLGNPDQYQYNNLSITATVRELTLEEIQVSGGVYVFGDMQFTIRQLALESEPNYADRITYGGLTYKLKSIKHIDLGGSIGWSIRAGKV